MPPILLHPKVSTIVGSKMRYLIVSILLSCLSISSLVSANILATRGKYQLSQADFNKMIFAGEKIAQHVFTPGADLKQCT